MLNRRGKTPRPSQTRKFSFSEKRRLSTTPYWTLLHFLLRAHRRWSAFLRLGHGAPARAGRIQVKLPHLIQQRFVTDPQHLCGILRHQRVFSKASAIASISASSFNPRTRAFSPCSRATAGSFLGAGLFRVAGTSFSLRKLPSATF